MKFNIAPGCLVNPSIVTRLYDNPTQNWLDPGALALVVGVRGNSYITVFVGSIGFGNVDRANMDVVVGVNP